MLAGPLQTIPGTALDGLQLLVRYPGGEHGQDLPEKTLGAPLIGLQVAGPLSFRLGQGTNLDPAVPESADGPDGVLPSSTDAVDGHHHQGIAAGQAVVQTVPSAALLGAGGARDADVAEQVLPGDTSPPELKLLGLGVHPGDALLEAAAGADVSVDLCHALEFTLMQRLPQHGNDSLFALFHTPVCGTDEMLRQDSVVNDRGGPEKAFLNCSFRGMSLPDYFVSTTP